MIGLRHLGRENRGEDPESKRDGDGKIASKAHVYLRYLKNGILALCGRGLTAMTAAFQAVSAGSTPAARTA